MPISTKTRAKKIKLLLFDVDGVMTDGSIWLFPAPQGAEQATQERAKQVADAGGFAVVSENVVEAKGFHAHDGTAISLARLGGLKTGLITKRISETVRLRARDLRLDHVHQGIEDKLAVFERILAEEGLQPEQAAYIGDDIIDLPVMRRCGLAVAVPNARKEVAAESHFVTRHPGGHGAIRDTVEMILAAQGSLERVLAAYLRARSPRKA